MNCRATKAPDEIMIRTTEVERIINLRWTILRAGLPREAANFDGDHEPTTHHFAAFSNDDVVACATFLRNSYENEPAWQLRGMAVNEGFQGTGLGSRLLEFAEGFILPQGYSNLLWCNARLPAERFYVRMGWRTVSEPFEIPDAPLHVKMIKRCAPSVR